MMQIIGSAQMAVVLAVLAISTAYMFTKLCIARSLVWEKQNKGLARSPLLTIIRIQLMTFSR